MSNLTPDQRPDRNGNIVTRWVKAFKTRKSAATAVPAPSISSHVDEDDIYGDEYLESKRSRRRTAYYPRKQLTDEEREVHRELSLRALRALDLNETYDRTCSSNVNFVVDHDPALIEDVLQASSGNKKVSDFLRALFNHRHISPNASTYGRYEEALSPERIQTRLQSVRTALVVASAACELFTAEDESDMSHHHAIYFLERTACHLAGEHEESADRIRACTTIAYIHGAHLREVDPEGLDAGDDEIDFFVENAERIEPLIQTLFERRSTDVELVRNLMDSSPALAEGML